MSHNRPGCLVSNNLWLIPNSRETPCVWAGGGGGGANDCMGEVFASLISAEIFFPICFRSWGVTGEALGGPRSHDSQTWGPLTAL